ncbi:MAG: hypothetical protein EOL89_03930 [Actinobacteria bacterium]|nr:hypothetical protein [Actinomycetota bacterium]
MATANDECVVRLVQDEVGLGRELRLVVVRNGQLVLIDTTERFRSTIDYEGDMWLGAKQDVGPKEQVEVFLKHEHCVQREIVKRGGGPWALSMSQSGIRPVSVKRPSLRA